MGLFENKEKKLNQKLTEDLESLKKQLADLTQSNEELKVKYAQTQEKLARTEKTLEEERERNDELVKKIDELSENYEEKEPLPSLDTQSFDASLHSLQQQLQKRKQQQEQLGSTAAKVKQALLSLQTTMSKSYDHIQLITKSTEQALTDEQQQHQQEEEEQTHLNGYHEADDAVDVTEPTADNVSVHSSGSVVEHTNAT